MTTDTPEPTIRVERRPQSLVAISVEVPADTLEQAAEKAFRRLVQKASIPGFRPGKAPRALYERQYGSNHLYEEAARDLVDEYYKQAVDANDLHPLDSPDVDIKRLGKGESLVFEATVAVRPPVELGDYKAHGQSVQPKAVTDEEVEKVVAGMREHHAELRPVQRPAQSGDVPTVDVEVTLDGKALPPFGRDAHIELGREYTINGLAEGLLGASEGETRTLELAFPDDYADADLRGKTGVFTVAVHQVSEKVLPGLDDEFAKTVGVENIDALRKTVRDELAHAAFHEGRDEAAEKALAHAIDTASVDVPGRRLDARARRDREARGHRRHERGAGTGASRDPARSTEPAGDPRSARPLSACALAAQSKGHRSAHRDRLGGHGARAPAKGRSGRGRERRRGCRSRRRNSIDLARPPLVPRFRYRLLSDTSDADSDSGGFCALCRVYNPNRTSRSGGGPANADA